MLLELVSDGKAERPNLFSNQIFTPRCMKYLGPGLQPYC